MHKLKILIISHDATRTGAPILLLNLVKCLHNDFDFEFLLKRGGILLNDFKNLAPVYLIEPQRHSVVNRIIRKITIIKRGTLYNIDWNGYDIIISNTITNGDILPLIRPLYKGKIISYIHELKMAAQYFTDLVSIKKLIKCTDKFIVPSLAVKDFLRTEYSIENDNIKLLNYYTPDSANVDAIDSTVHEIINKKFTVGSVGTVDWRKSPDLFVQVAVTVFSKEPNANINFIWKGISHESTEFDRIKYDIRKASLSNKITFVESSSDVKSFYDSLDVFLLTSREDPYPLVVLEAAGSNVPTICFKNAGGAPEFVQKNCGVCINFLDVNKMADAILLYYHNPSKKIKDGNSAKEKLIETHQNSSFILSQFNSVLNSL